MNCRSLIKSWFGQMNRRSLAATHRMSSLANRPEQLETRTVPTGNVTAQLVGRSLYLYGDEGANGVELTASGSNLVLRGLNNTTINGASNDFLVRSGVLEVRQSLFAYMGGGDDTLAISAAARIRRDAFVYMGEGNDTFAMNAGEAHRNLYVDLGNGSDSVNFDGALATHGVSITGGTGDKLISINNSRIADFFNVMTSSGNDTVVIKGSVLGDDVYIQSGLGDDTVVIDNSKLRDYATIDTSMGNDFVQISPTTTIGDDVNVFLGGGDDNAVLDGANTFGDPVSFFGQSGTDNVEIGANNVFDNGQNSYDTDGTTVDAATKTARLTDATTGATSRAEALRQALATAITPRTIGITLDKTAVSEAAGATAATGTVTRPTGSIGALTVALTSDLTTEATVPATVTIPAGQTSVTFAVAAVDDSTQDGNKTVNITAALNGFTSGKVTLSVEDNDTPLTLELSATTVTEAGGATALTGTVTRTGTVGDATVNLLSSDTSEITVPATVTIADGKSSATFDIAAVEDTVIDGTKTVTITASGTGFVSASKTVDVTDNETGTPALSLSLDKSTVSEGDGATAATATVSRNTEPTDALTVTLTSSNTSVATVPTTVTIPAGQTSVTFAVAAVDDQADNPDQTVTITATATGLTTATTNLTVTDNDIALDVVTAANNFVDSSGTLITKQQNFTVTGTTVPGATVALDTNGDGFNDGTQTASDTGAFSFTVPLTNTSTNHGANALRFRATTATNTTGTIEEVDVHRAVGSVVEFATNVGTFHVELLDTDAPITVANFKNYFSRYNNLIVQRSPADFVIQAGQFTSTNGVLSTVTTDAPITNEFNSANGNVKGTLSMALPANGPNQGTSQWFINVVDNSFLNANLHTVFGRVIGSGMDIVEAINSFPVDNQSSQQSNSALGEVPLIGNVAFEDLTGTVTVASGSTTLTGTGTAFLTQLTAKSSNVEGTTIRVGSQTFTVESIQSNTQLTLSDAATAASTNVVAQRHSKAAQANFIVFSHIGEVLNTI